MKMPPLSRLDLRQRIDTLPRIKIACLPTPLQESIKRAGSENFN